MVGVWAMWYQAGFNKYVFTTGPIYITFQILNTFRPYIYLGNQLHRSTVHNTVLKCF